MQRCLQLAALGSGRVAPNPMVGSVLVYNDRIIGEGYHQEYGKAHAEVNCLASVKEDDKPLIQQSTLYVSLEPCSHWGKTPPCADLIITKQIPKVVVGCRDPFPLVNGKGMEKLTAAGVEVIAGILEADCRKLNGRFFTFHTTHRPYVILKWAQSGNAKTGSIGERIFISSEYSSRLVHKWRSEEAAILVGTNTALADNPQLNTRLWSGKNPIRIVIDMNLRLPQSLHLFEEAIPTLVFNTHQHSLPAEKTTAGELTGVQYYRVSEDGKLVHQLLNGLYRLGIQSMLVEGGARVLQSFIDEGAWDEARVITNDGLSLDNGLPAPCLTNQQFIKTERLSSDTLHYYHNRML